MITDDIKAIVKVTEGCNLQCTYCYAGNFQPTELKHMSLDILECLISEMQGLGMKRVEYCWHGGEPLLAGIDFYQRAIQFQSKYMQPDQVIVNSLQTNATLINENWLRFFDQNEFGIGISIDGPAHLHDQQRPFSNGTGSHAKIVEVVEELLSRGKNVPVLCVVTDHTANFPLEIFHYLLSIGTTSVDFLPCSKINGVTGEIFSNGVNPSAYGKFMNKVFDEWWRLDNPLIRVRFFENVLQGLLGGQPSLCKFTRTCDRFFTFNFNGDVYPCDDYLGYENFRYGNILKNKLSEIAVGERRLRFTKAINDVSLHCLSCEWYSVCNSGCSYYRYMSRGRFTDVNYYCTASKMILEHVTEALQEIRVPAAVL